jgi:shikimate kinase
MNKRREIALEQALIALLGAAKNKGVSVQGLIDDATALVLDNSKYRQVENPNVALAITEMRDAYQQVLEAERVF